MKIGQGCLGVLMAVAAAATITTTSEAFCPSPALLRTTLAPGGGLREASDESSSQSSQSQQQAQEEAGGGEEGAGLPQQSAEIEEMKKELIAKYAEMGKSRELAEAELDEFFNDNEKSRKYLEMREYAQSQADLLGPELYLQFAGYFLLGVLGTAGPKYYHAYKVSSFFTSFDVVMGCVVRVSNLQWFACLPLFQRLPGQMAVDQFHSCSLVRQEQEKKERKAAKCYRVPN